MKKKLVLSFIATLLFANCSLALAKYTSPGQGTPERKVLLDAIRPAVEKEFRMPVVFGVKDIRVSGQWAVVVADPLDKKQKLLTCDRVIKEDSCELDNTLTISAILQNKSGKWSLVEHATGEALLLKCHLLPTDMVIKDRCWQ